MHVNIVLSHIITAGITGVATANTFPDQRH